MIIMLLRSNKAFNMQTLNAVRDYFETYQDDIVWKTKEDGFVRTELPITLLQLDETLEHFNQIAPFARLRANFWYPFENATIRKAQELNTPHTHRAPFASWVENGGYHHELFEEMPGYNCSEEEQYLKEKADIREVKVGTVGSVCLKKTRSDRVMPDDFVYYYPSAIHQLIKSEPQALSLNAVGQAVRTEIDTYTRETQEDQFEADVTLSREQNKEVTKTALKLFDRAPRWHEHEIEREGKSIVYGQP
ncbi:MAG TPA: hypothetical protein VHD33_06800 [Legionellaceae bacterium]|nr:hypothetical protein [Legionellaceae bacterium]